MKVLITGSSGFLGRITLELLKNSCDCEVISLGRNNLIMKSYIYSDLEKENLLSLKNRIPKDIDAIVHLAAHVDFSKNFSPKLFKINTIATNLLADIAAERNIRFIFASTATIAGTKNEYININSDPRPDTNYALSKWLTEEYLLATMKYALILRFGGIFGLNGPSHLSLNISVTKALTEKKSPLIYGSGKFKRNYIYVKDAAKAIKYGLENNIKGVHLLAGSEVLSIEEMAQKLCNLYIPGSSPVYVADNSEKKDQIIEPSRYFHTTLSFEEALKDIKCDYEKNSTFG